MPNETIPSWTKNSQKKGSLLPVRGCKYSLIDAHLHVTDFVQHSPGGQALIQAMDRSNIEKAVIFGLPVRKIWSEIDRESPDYYLANDSRCYYYSLTDVIVAQLYRSMTTIQQNRLFPLICGFNPVDRYAVRDVERILDLFPEVFCGIGELLLRHDDLTSLTYGEPARANNRALWPVYELAAQRNLPVLIHQNVTSVSKSDHPVYLYELEQALRDNPRTTFVLAHCGISRRVEVPFYYLMVERLLEQYPRLYVDYSWIIYDMNICPGGNPDLKWVDLTERFSDRICIGSDLVTRFERLGLEMSRYEIFLDVLSSNARDNICYHTAEKIYNTRKPIANKR
jgi:hypothetical protein